MNEIENNIVFKNMETGQALDKTIDVTKLAREPGHNQSYRRDITIEPTNWSNAQGDWILLSVKQIPEQVSVDNKSFVKRSDREYGSRFFLESRPFLRDMKLCESNEADNISGVIGFSEPIEVTTEEIQQSVTITKDGQEVGVIDEGYVSDGVQRKIYITIEQWNGGTLHIDISDAVTSPTDKSLEQKSYSIDFPADLSGCEVRRTEFPQ
jgi:hypothetical protein